MLPLVRALGQVFQVLGLFFQNEIKACRDCKIAEILKSQVMLLPEPRQVLGVRVLKCPTCPFMAFRRRGPCSL